MPTCYQARAGLCIKGKLNAEALKIKTFSPLHCTPYHDPVQTVH